MAFADGERILAGPSDGSSMAVVAMQDSGVGALTADSAFIYWIAGASLGMERPGCSMGNAPYCMTYPSFDAGISDGLFAVSWSGGPVRTISKHGGLVDIRAAGNALWGILRGGQSSPDQLVKVDTASGQHAIVAGGGPIGGLAVDSTSVYFTRGTKLLSTPL
jgi:hypothetical protein